MKYAQEINTNNRTIIKVRCTKSYVNVVPLSKYLTVLHSSFFLWWCVMTKCLHFETKGDEWQRHCDLSLGYYELSDRQWLSEVKGGPPSSFCKTQPIPLAFLPCPDNEIDWTWAFCLPSPSLIKYLKPTTAQHPRGFVGLCSDSETKLKASQAIVSGVVSTGRSGVGAIVFTPRGSRERAT